MPTPTLDPSWIETLHNKSYTYDTTDDITAVTADGYFTGVTKGSVIKVRAMSGADDIAGVLMVTADTPQIETALLDQLDTGIDNASLPYIAFKGTKWEGPPASPSDNARAFEVADAFDVPVYIGPGRFYTSLKPKGSYFGEGIIYCRTADNQFTFEIPLSATAVRLDTAIELLEWKSQIQGETHDASADDYEQSLNLALGPRAGVRFAPETDSSVAVGYKALSNAGRNCESSTAVGAKALGSCGGPIRSEAIGTGAMADSTYTNRSTCIGNGAGRWAGCEDPVRANHDYFHANVTVPIEDDPRGYTNSFDEWERLDPSAREDLVGPVSNGQPNFEDPNTVDSYLRHTVPDSDYLDPYPDDPRPEDSNVNNVYVGRDAGNHNVLGSFNTFVGAHAAHGWNISYSTFVGANCGEFALTSSNCVGIGYLCLTSNVRGEFNTAGGVHAMQNNVFGEHNGNYIRDVPTNREYSE